ncbi:chaperonin HslO [Aedoeadaptatus nemausensis]|uniref:33 kDa chaperonin n=1 Tax=Aedoeadaptatus nemausensis TaxID=2582829 RepID=A0A6V6XYK4_9FIRM|nr:Hsp33 family molecular chaperone HslO [Peptoniphilus nemausensis]CAC9922481.1 chaperonin HslO [Peptoniphilus nemausensis]
MKDICIRAINETGTIKVSVVTATALVETAHITHQTSATATAALGRSLIAGILLRNKLKNDNDSLTMIIDGGGPLGRIVVTGKNDGHVKGYVDHPMVDLPTRGTDGKLDVSGIVGLPGTLTVTMDLGMRQPYTGKVSLATGEIGDDVAAYLFQSEQIPSAVGLGVSVDTDLSVKKAGGFIVEIMPGATNEEISELEAMLKEVKSVTELLEEGLDAKGLMNAILPNLDLKILSEAPVAFVCECSKDKVADSIAALPDSDIREMMEEDHGAEAVCHFCNRRYEFSEEELESMLSADKE